MNKITTISPINRRFTSFSDSFLLMILPAMPPPIPGKEDNIPSTRPTGGKVRTSGIQNFSAGFLSPRLLMTGIRQASRGETITAMPEIFFPALYKETEK